MNFTLFYSLILSGMSLRSLLDISVPVSIPTFMLGDILAQLCKYYHTTLALQCYSHEDSVT